MSDDQTPKSPAVPGLLQGQKACFRFMIPTAWQEMVPGLKNQVTMRQQIGFVPCIGKDCMLWNEEAESLPAESKGECWDVTKGRAAARIAKLKWDEVAGSEH